MTASRWLAFVAQLFAVLVLSVSVWPLLPWWLTPGIIPLVIVAFVIQDDLAASARWAIWGGLAFDLLAPGWFAVRWLSLLVVAVLARESRRLVAIRDLPWLWPLWFGLGALIATLPLALLTHQLRLSLQSAAAAAIWGPVSLALVLWFASNRRSSV